MFTPDIVKSLQEGQASLRTEAQGRAAVALHLQAKSSELMIADGSYYGQDADGRQRPGFVPDRLQSPQEEPWPRDRLQLW